MYIYIYISVLLTTIPHHMCSPSGSCITPILPGGGLWWRPSPAKPFVCSRATFVFFKHPTILAIFRPSRLSPSFEGTPNTRGVHPKGSRDAPRAFVAFRPSTWGGPRRFARRCTHRPPRCWRPSAPRCGKLGMSQTWVSGRLGSPWEKIQHPPPFRAREFVFFFFFFFFLKVRDSRMILRFFRNPKGEKRQFQASTRVGFWGSMCI